jgi:thioredoxin reductase
MDFDVTIVGAGPFGLSAAAYLKDRGMVVSLFVDPMSFCRDHMPAGMYLRSNWAGSHISDPNRRFTLDHFQAETGAQFKFPIPLERFVEYGQWYQRNAVPDLVPHQVCELEKSGNGFTVKLSDGNFATSKRVIIATGIAHFPWMPKEFEGKPKTHVSHSFDHCDLSRFRGLDMLVIGGARVRLTQPASYTATTPKWKLSPGSNRSDGSGRMRGCTTSVSFLGASIRI